MSRLTIDLSDNQHQALKAKAALEGKTIRQFALERLFPAPAPQPGQPNEEAAWQDFIAEMERRADEAMAGHVADKSFDEIVEAAIARAEAVD